MDKKARWIPSGRHPLFLAPFIKPLRNAGKVCDFATVIALSMAPNKFNQTLLGLPGLCVSPAPLEVCCLLVERPGWDWLGLDMQGIYCHYVGLVRL